MRDSGEILEAAIGVVAAAVRPSAVGSSFCGKEAQMHAVGSVALS